MSWKETFAVMVALVLLTVVAGMALAPQEGKAAPETGPQEFHFRLQMQDYGCADSANAASFRNYLTVLMNASGTDNFTLSMISLGKPQRGEIYEVNDYPSSDAKQKTLAALKAGLGSYGVYTIPISLDVALGKRGAVIILPTDAMPDALADGTITGFLDDNTIIFFGKPMDISVDRSGSQTQLGGGLYGKLNVSAASDGSLTSTSSGQPTVSKAGNATVLEYPNGWLVVYPEREDSALGTEIASLIIAEGWQGKRDVGRITEAQAGNRTVVTMVSGPLQTDGYSTRLVYEAIGNGPAIRRVLDFGAAQKPYGTLKINDRVIQGERIDYTFELHTNLTYPETHAFNITFTRDGLMTDTEPAKQITLKTFARESGVVAPNLSSGDYVARLVDSGSQVHASAYLHVPELKVSLVRIEGEDHVFKVTVDGKPAKSARLVLTVNGKDEFALRTNDLGETRAAFMLSPGVYSFTIALEGQQTTIYYKKEGDETSLMLYAVIIAGAGFLVAAVALKANRKKKWALSTYRRPAAESKIIRIPYGTFITIFSLVQKHRAPGMPLSVSDLRIGMRKYAAYKGAPLFLTDSNVYNVLDSLVRKGRMLSYSGYFMPSDAAEGKPVEYWVTKRKLADHLLENGEELESARNGFVMRGKHAYLWPDIDPRSVRSGSTLIFPDKKRKSEFFRIAARYEPAWMRLSLELQYGSVRFLTIDELMGGGHAGGKG